MAQDTINNDLYVNGNVACKTLTPPAGSITDSAILQNAAIQASKLQIRLRPTYNQPDGVASASEQRLIHRVVGATGTIQQFLAGTLGTLIGSPDTLTVDLFKNGSTILSAPISLLAGDTLRVFKTATFTSTAVVAGDVLEVVVTYTHTSGTAPKGVAAQLVIDEPPV